MTILTFLSEKNEASSTSNLMQCCLVNFTEVCGKKKKKETLLSANIFSGEINDVKLAKV